MTIRNKTAFNESLPANHDGVFDWDFLLPCWRNTKITPTDIDAAIERSGNILLFETKRPHNKVGYGQRRLLSHLVKYGHGYTTVLYISGKTEDNIKGFLVVTFYDKRKQSIHYGLGTQDLITFCSEWFRCAQRGEKYPWEEGIKAAELAFVHRIDLTDYDIPRFNQLEPFFS